MVLLKVRFNANQPDSFAFGLLTTPSSDEYVQEFGGKSPRDKFLRMRRKADGEQNLEIQSQVGGLVHNLQPR